MKQKWNDDSIMEFATKNTDNKYIGYDVTYNHDGKRNRKRIFIKMICNNCNEEYQTNIDILKKNRGKMCFKCSHQRMVDECKKHDIDTARDLFKQNGMELLDEKYINSCTPMTAVDKEGYKVYTSYNNLLKGFKGMIFRNDNPHTLDNIKLFIERNALGYKLISEEYVRADGEKLWFECEKDHVFECSWNDFRNGTRCPVCNSSKGEEAVRIWLEENNIEYVQEYRFHNCRHKYTLPFDFYLPTLNTAIEYDGGQHFEPVEFFGGTKGFKERKRNEEIKNNYCKKNGIKLIRIPYTVEDIGENLNELYKESML